jgi:hypothetical protein
MYAVRRWSVRNARFLEIVYAVFADALLRLHLLWRLIGYRRLDAPMAAIEKRVKGFMFDCRMCGECLLTHTGMSCPMNCPKGLRNGPCGGVRGDGGCEVDPDMPCVWVAAWEGTRRMKDGDMARAVQPAVDHSIAGTSSWLRVTARAAAEKAARSAGGR